MRTIRGHRRRVNSLGVRADGGLNNHLVERRQDGGQVSSLLLTARLPSGAGGLQRLPALPGRRQDFAASPWLRRGLSKGSGSGIGPTDRCGWKKAGGTLSFTQNRIDTIQHTGSVARCPSAAVCGSQDRKSTCTPTATPAPGTHVPPRTSGPMAGACSAAEQPTGSIRPSAARTFAGSEPLGTCCWPRSTADLPLSVDLRRTKATTRRQQPEGCCAPTK